MFFGGMFALDMFFSVDTPQKNEDHFELYPNGWTKTHRPTNKKEASASPLNR